MMIGTKPHGVDPIMIRPMINNHHMKNVIWCFLLSSCPRGLVVEIAIDPAFAKVNGDTNNNHDAGC
jgi:hypothetical protein